jgi:hypothetical protein
LAVRLYAETTLQGRGAPVHNARADDGMALKLFGQSFQEGVALSRVNRRCGLHDGVVFVVRKAERHRRGSGWARATMMTYAPRLQGVEDLFRTAPEPGR